MRETAERKVWLVREVELKFSLQWRSVTTVTSRVDSAKCHNGLFIVFRNSTIM